MLYLFILPPALLTSVFYLLAISELSRYSRCLPLFEQYTVVMPSAIAFTETVVTVPLINEFCKHCLLFTITLYNTIRALAIGFATFVAILQHLHF